MITIPNEIKEPIYVRQEWNSNSNSTLSYYKILPREDNPFLL